MPIDYRSGNGKGYAYVQYCDPVAAQHALDVLDGTAFQGRLLHIIPSNSKNQSSMNESTVSQLSFKKQQQVKRRSEAASSTFNWNSMFMNVGILNLGVWQTHCELTFSRQTRSCPRCLTGLALPSQSS